MQAAVLQVDPRDNVLIALTDLKRGQQIEYAGKSYTLVSNVPARHKFAIEDLAVGHPVRMYGILVGKAVKPIPKGEQLEPSNVAPAAAAFNGQSSHRPSGEYHWVAPDVSRWRASTFAGYRRSDGQVGTRNYWLVVPLVFCENRNIAVLKQAFEEELGYAPSQVHRRQVAELARLYREGSASEVEHQLLTQGLANAAAPRLFENVDGIRFLLHQSGCGGTREDSRNLCGLIAGYINHPNVAGATVLSLGCQHAQIGILREQLNQRNPRFDKPLILLEQQRSASEFSMLSEAVRRTFLGLVEANQARREPARLSYLRLGLKCGGSDGFSGISANPAIGHTADLLVALGGSAILSEFPELGGVEQDVVNRSTRKEVSERFVALMRDYQSRASAVGSEFEAHASSSNIRDGLLTNAMRSAGAARKGGRSPISAVLDYPEYITEAGLNLQCTPAKDAECVTAQAGAGANIVLFTTGLGASTGNPIAPVVKISSHSDLAERMSDIIDVDAGKILVGETSVEQLGEEILDEVIRIASGEVKTKSERNGQADFSPWKRGVSL